jgi:Uma2 family endonuclease
MRHMAAVKRRVSFADLQRMPEDGHRYELYDGELCVAPSALPRHEIVSMRLHDSLGEHRRIRGGYIFHPPFDLVLSDHDVVQPDLMYFGPLRAQRVRPDEYVRFTPDLAIEILSPSTQKNDRGRKRDLYARHGLPEYWVVDPYEHRIEISVLAAGRYRDPVVIASGIAASPTQPGLAVDLAVLFDGL